MRSSQLLVTCNYISGIEIGQNARFLGIWHGEEGNRMKKRAKVDGTKVKQWGYFQKLSGAPEVGIAVPSHPIPHFCLLASFSVNLMSVALHLWCLKSVMTAANPSSQ